MLKLLGVLIFFLGSFTNANQPSSKTIVDTGRRLYTKAKPKDIYTQIELIENLQSPGNEIRNPASLKPHFAESKEQK